MMIASMLWNQTVPMSSVYAVSNAEMIRHSDDKTMNLVYVEDGEGAESDGDGSETSPFQNIYKALREIQQGDVLVLCGTVMIARYDTDQNGAPIPFFIDKEITVRGKDKESGLYLRTSLQLGADVVLEHMKLQIPKESGIMRSNTIYLAGHSLVLDDVNTRIGTSPEQAGERPNISGGMYAGGTLKGQKAGGSHAKEGKNASVLIRNANDETLLGTIYAGDYYRASERNVDIHLACNLTDTTIYTGGLNDTLTGDVNLYLYQKANVKEINQNNHSGKVNVTLQKGATSTRLNLDQVDSLVLQESSVFRVPEDGEFTVGDVTIGRKSVLDVRGVSKNQTINQPVVTGALIGSSKSEGYKTCGTVLIGDNQTLEVAQGMTGLIRLNSEQPEIWGAYVADHVYVRIANGMSGSFVLGGGSKNPYEVVSSDGDVVEISVRRSEVTEEERFSTLAFQDGPDYVIAPEIAHELKYKLAFTNAAGNPLELDDVYVANNFTCEVERADQTPWESEDDIECYITSENGEHSAMVYLWEPERCYGSLIIKVIYEPTGQVFQKKIRVFATEDDYNNAPPQEDIDHLPGDEETEDGQPEDGDQDNGPTGPDAGPGSQPEGEDQGTQTPDLPPVLPPIETPAAPVNPPVTEPELTPDQTPEVPQLPTPGQTPEVTPAPAPVPEQTPEVTPAQTPVPVKKSKLTLSSSNLTLYMTVNKTASLIAVVTGPEKEKKVVFSSSNSNVAKVNSNGTVIAVKEGTAVITAKAGTVSASCVVTVKKPSIKLNKSSVTMYTVNEKNVQLKPTIVGPTKKVTFESSRSSVVRVDKYGNLKAVKAGTATITATANGVTTKCSITVKNPELKIAKTNITIKNGKKTKIHVTATPVNKITYSSNKSSVAYVDRNGVILAKRRGTATITVRCNGMKKTVKVTVK